MPRMVNNLIYCYACAVLSACGNTPAESNLQGQWLNYDEGVNIFLTVYDDNLYCGEDGMDGLEFGATFNTREGDSITFNVDNRFPGYVAYNPETKALTLNVKGLLDGGDFNATFNEANHFSAVANIDESAAERTVYESSEFQTSLYEAAQGEALPIIGMTNDLYNVEIAGKASGYVPQQKFEIVRASVSQKATDKSYSATTQNERLTYSFVKKGDNVTIDCNTMMLDGSHGFDTFYGGTIQGNSIIVDCKSSDYEAFEAVNISAFDKLDEPFVIYFVETPYYTSLVVNGIVYHEEEF